MKTTRAAMKKTWEDSFEEQIAHQAYNTSPVEALIRTISYYLRDRHPSPKDRTSLHFMEMGCGAGPNLLWLAQKGVKVSGLDISPKALGLARTTLEKSGHAKRIGQLAEGSVHEAPFEDESFDGIIEACVFQHLDKNTRRQAFAEVRRCLKPGGVFVGYMLERGHTIYQTHRREELEDDPGTLLLQDGSSKFHLSNIGLSHFFNKDEYFDYFRGFSTVDPCLTTYYLPREEAKKRNYPEYLQSMWTVYAVK